MPKNNLIAEPIPTVTIRCDCGRYLVVVPNGETVICPDCKQSHNLVNGIWNVEGEKLEVTIEYFDCSKRK